MTPETKYPKPLGYIKVSFAGDYTLDKWSFWKQKNGKIQIKHTRDRQKEAKHVTWETFLKRYTPRRDMKCYKQKEEIDDEVKHKIEGYLLLMKL